MANTTDDVTERAKRGAHISLIFEAAVKRVFTNYAVEMTRPQGGARALLHIRLVTEGSTYALGWANPTDGTAELFTLGRTLAISKRRRGRELTLPPLSYARFLETAQCVLEDFGMTVTVVAYTKDDDAALDASEDTGGDGLDSESEGDGPDSEPRRRTPTHPYLGLPNDS